MYFYQDWSAVFFSLIFQILSAGSEPTVFHWQINGDLKSHVPCTPNSVFSIQVNDKSPNNKASSKGCTKFNPSHNFQLWLKIVNNDWQRIRYTTLRTDRKFHIALEFEILQFACTRGCNCTLLRGNVHGNE